ncbi:MAG: glutamine-hydrolyzing GMP synthase, partial [Paludibacteraceae bacterium]|nr:glutamine-hydrolyzing GMP synthase [Paludibacteraceae bacterium]
MQKIIILDFGSQTTQLIARRVREMNTFCEVMPYNKYPQEDKDVIGVILSGSPYSVHDKESFRLDFNTFIDKKPVLGICYGAQLMSYEWGGTVDKTDSREYGRAILKEVADDVLLKDIQAGEQVWMSHGDTITSLPVGFHLLASTQSVRYAAYRTDNKPIWGVQFHPEVVHSAIGERLLKNFVV